LRSLWEPAVESIEHSSTLCRGRRQSGCVDLAAPRIRAACSLTLKHEPLY
jgi:hypothetical protein